MTPQSADEWYCAWITTKSTYESFEPESYIQGVYYGLNNIAVDKQMTMSDYVKSIAKQGTAEWSNYDGDLKPKTDYVILAFYVDPNNEDQLKVYDYAYTKAEFRTETPETEVSLTLGDIKNLTDNGDGTAEVTVHVKASLATSYRIGAHTQTEIDEEIANGYGPEDWGGTFGSVGVPPPMSKAFVHPKAPMSLRSFLSLQDRDIASFSESVVKMATRKPSTNL